MVQWALLYSSFVDSDVLSQSRLIVIVIASCLQVSPTSALRKLSFAAVIISH